MNLLSGETCSKFLISSELEKSCGGPMFSRKKVFFFRFDSVVQHGGCECERTVQI